VWTILQVMSEGQARYNGAIFIKFGRAPAIRRTVIE